MPSVTEDRKISAAGRVKRIASKLRRAPLIPLIIIGMFAFTAIFANFLTPYSPTKPFLGNRLRPPFWIEGGSLTHPLGTDPLGRDILTRIIYGARVSVTVAPSGETCPSV